MTSLDERLQKSNYANWLQVAYALKCVKDGLCIVTERIMSQFQEEIKSQNNIDAVCNNESCNSKSIRREGVHKFCCPKKVCDSFMKSIAAEHMNKSQIFWENCEVQQWPVKCWEIAKAYMGRGQTSANTKPATTDCAGLLQLITKCKQFQSKIRLNHIAAEKIITIRNQTMHSPDLSLEDEYKTESLNKMVSFLETVLCRMKETYDDVSDCEGAIDNIKQLSEVKLTVEMERTCLVDEVFDIRTRLLSISDEDSSFDVELARTQTTLLVEIVHSDPFFSALTVLNDRMNDVLHCIANIQDHTGQRVDSIETRVKQLELRPPSLGPSYKNSLQNYVQGRGWKLPEYKATPQLNGGYQAQVIVCDQVFQSSQVRTKKVDAEQDAAKLAFEHLQQQHHGDNISAASTACAAGDADAAAASDMPVSASGLVSTYSLTVAAVDSQYRGTVTSQSSDQRPAGHRQQSGLIINKKSSSYLSILELLCAELRLDPPTVAMSKKLAECTATLSVNYGFSSSQSHTKKTDAQEDAACVALSGLKEDAKSARNCRARLNEYCQQQQSAKPDYRLSDSGPFTCTVFVHIIHTSLALPTECEASDDAAREILTKLGHASHVLRTFVDPQFEDFSVSCDTHSVFTLTARYHFSRPTVGDKSKKNAEKLAAEHVLAVLYPDLDPKPSLDQCKNKLQELYTQEKPKYLSVSGEDGLYYSAVSVTFQEQISCDSRSTLSVTDDLAERACKRLGLIS